MIKINDVVDTIKDIECAVDQWQNKVIEAYKEYADDDEYEIAIERDESLDCDEIKAYTVKSSYSGHDEIVVLVSEGSEGYVANVEDAYVRNCGSIS